MPNIITHKIFAEEVYRRCKRKDIKHLLEKHFQLYYIGSNGPDFLFFYHMKPWEAWKEHSLNEMGSELHRGHVNAFYESAIATIRHEKDPFTKESEIAYLMGHLCHWALDMITHPYIFYRTGDCKGASAGLHHRFESMMDAMMLQRYHQMDIADYRCSEICQYDDEMLKAIARIYVPALKDALDKEVKVNQLRSALTSWGDIQDLLYDPNHTKVKAVKAVERVINRPWLLSGNIVPKWIDETFDVLNLEKQIWIHPCDDQVESDASFLELFEEAIKIALQALDKAYGCIEYDADVEHLLNLLGDRAYDTGREEGCEMKHFDVIYHHETI